MNESTVFKIEENLQYIIELRNYLAKNPEQKWILKLIDEPFLLTLAIMDQQGDYHEIAKKLNCNWQTVKQIKRILEQ